VSLKTVYIQLHFEDCMVHFVSQLCDVSSNDLTFDLKIAGMVTLAMGHMCTKRQLSMTFSSTQDKQKRKKQCLMHHPLRARA